ncbi:MAG: plasmid pRiA4b ORF-3 family protein [Rubrobacter sp.]|nr:plasmid pRiA4b ORF-3 family protein [Rubrobacter sp.]
MSTEGTIHEIRVMLLASEPLIWRRVRLSGESNLEELHHVIQTVMDWENYHMHQFVTDDRRYGVDEDFMPDPESERTTTLRGVIPDPDDRLIYEYDIGDGWEHGIMVEEILSPEEGVPDPVCVGGEYAAPPEDCGGIPGYYMMLEAIEDEEHPDHEEMIEWVGGDFDPVTFDLDRINRNLEALR